MEKISIKHISDKQIWEEFSLKQSPSVFMQSWNWGQFQKSLKRKVWYLGIFGDKELIGICLCYKVPTKLRTHIYTSNGPIIDLEKAHDIMPALLKKLRTFALKEDALFVRLDPLILDSEENKTTLRQLGLKRATTNTQAENKWILDISSDEDILLSKMRKNTRYSIKRSAKEGVRVDCSLDFKDFDKFWDLYIETVERQKFIPHDKDYYINQIKAFAQDRQYRIYWAHLKGKILATALIPFYGDTAYYLHAASSNEIKNTFPAHALIWQSIKDAKAEGLTYFDFWGIAPTDNPKHQWAGFSFFKKGFGGFRQDVIRAHDLPISPKYKIVRTLEANRNLWGRKYYKIKNLFQSK